MRLVILESPYRGNVLANEQYARRAMKDSIVRGEAPFASHLLYTQKGILDDAQRDDRELGIRLGFAWSHCADMHVFYTDLGWSKGMIDALAFCKRTHMDFEFRAVFGPCRYPSEWDQPISEQNITGYCFSFTTPNPTGRF